MGSDPMRVIHLIGGGDTGGAKTHVLNLLKELNQYIDAQLFCFRKGDFSEDAAKMGIPIEVIESGNPVVGLRELFSKAENPPAGGAHKSPQGAHTSHETQTGPSAGNSTQKG